MSATAPSPRPYVDSYLGACWVCKTLCITVLLLWKNYLVANLLIRLESGIGWSFNSSPIPTGLFLVLAILPAIILPAPRVLGIVPLATVLLGFAVLGSSLNGESHVWTQLVFTAIGGILAATLRYMVFYGCRTRMLPRTPMRWRGIDIALIAGCITSLLGIFVWHRGEIERLKTMEMRWFLFPATLVFLLFAWTRLFRPFFELCVEAKVYLNYRLSVAGPGAANVPIRGPLVVIANHACWWDPLFLAGCLPRPVTPMMTSLFYDKWFLHPLMKYVFGTIRVPDSRARREAPEIQEAIHALDEGKCLILFPEGFLRRNEEVPLRRFGRGIWEILRARPDVPVVCCWIEGAWGSYASYWNGPPTKNKHTEGRRKIVVAISDPISMPQGLLDHHLKTRIYLMNAVSEARQHIGLEPLPKFDLPAKNDEPEQPA